MAKNSKSGGKFRLILALIPVLLSLIPVYFTYINNEPLSFILPNMLLFTPFRSQARAMWEKLIESHLDTNIEYGHTHIPSIEAKDYTFESLKRATNDFRSPAVVRGMFLGTPAAEKWPTEGYLPSRIGEFKIPVVKEATLDGYQADRMIMPFGDAFTQIITNSTSKMYLFFPVQSRFSYNGSDIGAAKELQRRVNEIVREDLELDRIWKGFGLHSTYNGAQLIVGQGTADTAETTGTGWHCAPGNNWFIQVVGRKRWFFMDQKYSAFMEPLRGGVNNMMTGTDKSAKRHKHLPLKYVDLEPGDMLYNPDWEWHTIQNYEGLAIGVPIRELNLTIAFRNNFQYTSIIVANRLAHKFGIDLGGYA